MKDKVVRSTLVCLFLIVMGMSTGISYAISPYSVVAMWLFDEGAGQIVGDSSGNGHDGEFVKTPVWVAEGVLGGALRFSGCSVRIPHDDSLSLASWSITAWVKLEHTVVWGYVLTKQKPFDIRNYTLYIHRDTRVPMADFHCEAGLRQVMGKTKVDDEQWHHLAGTYDMKALRVYFDGNLEGELAAADTPDTNDGAITIGADMTDVCGCGIRGTVDEVGLFNRALTKSEIKSIMELGLAEASQAVEASGKLSTAWGKIKAERY